MNMIIIFTIATFINVILQTVRSLTTVKGGKWAAAIINAICYGAYTYIIILTVSDIDLYLKILITALANFVCVFIVKFVEEKLRKDKLWEVRATIDSKYAHRLNNLAKAEKLSFNYIPIDKYTIFNFYCETQKDSQKVKDLLSNFTSVKYFVSESQSL